MDVLNKIKSFIGHAKHNRVKNYEKPEHILDESSSFDTVETYKSIRTNIMFSIPKSEQAKVIAITSSVPGEGKSTTSINLAITFAQMGARVLLMDCDLRKARIHRYLELERQDGVTNVLCGFIGIDKALKRDVRPNLDCLTGGEIPPNPAELLETKEFGNLINELKTRYDYIFIDTPPVTVVTDATIVMKHCAGVVVVVRKDVTNFNLLDITVDDIAKTGATPLGFVILGGEQKVKKYGYYRSKYGNRRGYKYGYQYGYHYGDNPDDPDKDDDEEAEG